MFRHLIGRSSGLAWARSGLVAISVWALASSAHAGALSDAAAILDAGSPGPRLSNEACALLGNTLGPAKATGTVNRAGAIGLGGTPVACERGYDTADGPTLVSVYTDPKFIDRVESGPPTPGVATKVKINGTVVFVQDAATTGLPGLLAVARPSGIIVFAIDNPKGSISSAAKMVQAMDIAAFKAATPSAQTAPSASSEGDLRRAAEEIKSALLVMLGRTVKSLEASIDPIGAQPRCVDVGDLLQDHPDFLYFSTLVGTSCVQSSIIPEPAADARVNGLKVVFEESEQSFSGTYTTRGQVELSPSAVVAFQAEGQRADALSALQRLDFSILTGLL